MPISSLKSNVLNFFQCIADEELSANEVEFWNLWKRPLPYVVIAYFLNSKTGKQMQKLEEGLLHAIYFHDQVLW